TPSDQRSLDSSPKTCAATHVLHRLQAPRHSPYALSSLLSLNLSTHVVSKPHDKELESEAQAPALRRGPESIVSQTLRRQLSITGLFHETSRRNYCLALGPDRFDVHLPF